MNGNLQGSPLRLPPSGLRWTRGRSDWQSDLPPLNFGFLPTAPPHGAPGRFRGPKKKIVFHCGGFAAAMKNIFFMFFLPCWGGFRRFPRRRPEKAKLQEGGGK